MRSTALPLSVALAVAVTLVVSVTCPSVARADLEGDRIAAAALADTALERYQRGDLRGALELFARASSLVRAPSFALYEARCLARLGRLSEADEAYGRAEQLDEGPSATPLSQRAVADARLERAALQRKRDEAPPAEARSASVTPPPPAPTDRTPLPTASPRSPSTSALVALGAGAAGVAVGITWGAIMLSRKSSLDDACPGGRCPASRSDDLDGYRSARTISTVGWGVGLVGLGLGAGLWIGGASSPHVSAGVRVLVGPTGASAVTTF